MISVMQHISSSLRRVMRRVLSDWQVAIALLFFGFVPSAYHTAVVDNRTTRGLAGIGKRRGCPPGIFRKSRA